MATLYEKLSGGLTASEHRKVAKERGPGDIHAALNALGMTPGIGAPADLLNASLYLSKGKIKDSLWSLLSMVPIVGLAAGAKRLSNLNRIKWYQDTVERMLNHSKDLSPKTIKKLKTIKSNISGYMEGSHKKSRSGRNQRGINTKGFKIEKVDAQNALKFDDELKAVSKESDLLNIEYARATRNIEKTNVIPTSSKARVQRKEDFHRTMTEWTRSGGQMSKKKY